MPKYHITNEASQLESALHKSTLNCFKTFCSCSVFSVSSQSAGREVMDMDSTSDMDMRNAFMIQTKMIVEGLTLPAVGCIGIFGNIL